MAAAPVDEATTAASSDHGQQIEITDVNSVKALSFRQLQKACVSRGLPAVGNTAALRSRLLESAGLPDVSAPAAPASAVNGSDDEVSRVDFCNGGVRKQWTEQLLGHIMNLTDPQLQIIFHWE